MGINFCYKPITSRSKYSDPDLHRCYRLAGHTGRCSEFPFLEHLQQVAPKVRSKIIRDATMTTGASWKSDDAGPNRIRRWAMLLPDKTLRDQFGINMSSLKPQVVSKLREKAATYEDCMAVAKKLTFLAYGMPSAPQPPSATVAYLEALFGTLVPNSTVCLVCEKPLSFTLFRDARRGKAEIETAHSNPRLHSPDNVGFAHRSCNIAQGPLSLEEFMIGWKMF
ncbi:MAG: hypothetical protein OXG99_16680 [Alphaproteobacteria bacterium]|nr:hypothetical protein [Alphaproteobacteria bacterium]